MFDNIKNFYLIEILNHLQTNQIQSDDDNLSGTVYGLSTDVTTVSRGIELLRNLPALVTANPSESPGGSVVQSLTTSRTGDGLSETLYPVYLTSTQGIAKT